MQRLSFLALPVALTLPIGLLARSGAPPAGQNDPNRSVPIYQVTVVQRALRAVNFQRHGGPTKVDLKGTILLPKGDGEARVEVKNGYTEIDANFRKLDAPTQFGNEFLTYVLWAITPDGHAINLGEVLANGSNKAHMRVTSPYSTFGLLVTAEPYFSVPYPSDVVVMESVVRPDTVGQVENVEAKYELLPRGQYTLHVKPKDLPSARMQQQTDGLSMSDYEAILELYQARNAVQIARADGAAQYAGPTFAKAEDALNQAETLSASKGDKTAIINAARQAVQAASDARAVAMKHK